MANLGKVSFSFSKISKKPSLQVQPKEIVKKVDKIEFIDSIENNSVQVINGEAVEEIKPLVIPLQHPNLLIQSVIDTVKSRTENSGKNQDDEQKNGSNEKEQPEAKSENGNDQPPKKETLEEMAARELIEAATGQSEKKPESTLTVPLANPNYDKAESTIDDYENIPVNDFGLAMLRGMGWDPKKGIGKNGQIVKVTGPTLRPKGLGLGADKSIAAQKPVGKNVSEKEVLAKGSKVRVTVGPHKNLYGTVEGFDDDAGRINVFMALSNERISMNECFVQLVTPDEFGKYSKVININAYNNYKEKESGETNIKQEEEESDKKSTNGRTKSPDSRFEAKDSRFEAKDSRYEAKDSRYEAKDVRHSSSSRSKYDKSKKYDSEDEKYSKDKRGGSSSNRNKKSTKKYDSSSDSDSPKYDRSSKSSSSKDRHRSKRHDDSDDNRKNSRSKSKYESSKSKSSKKYSSDSDSSDEKDKRKSRSKDSRRDRERRKSLSDSDDYARKTTSKKSKKKRNRSRSRSGR